MRLFPQYILEHLLFFPKESPCPVQVTPHFPFPSQLLETSNLLSVSAWLIFYKDIVMYHVVLCAWLPFTFLVFIRFIHVIAWIRAQYFNVEYYSALLMFHMIFSDSSEFWGYLNFLHIKNNTVELSVFMFLCGLCFVSLENTHMCKFELTWWCYV